MTAVMLASGIICSPSRKVSAAAASQRMRSATIGWKSCIGRANAPLKKPTASTSAVAKMPRTSIIWPTPISGKTTFVRASLQTNAAVATDIATAPPIFLVKMSGSAPRAES